MLASLVVAIEGGGSRLTVNIASLDGVVATASSGSCNYSTLGLNGAIDRIRSTTLSALSNLPVAVRPKDVTHLPPEKPLFAALQLGIAGCDRQSDVDTLVPALMELFGLADPSRCRVGNDASLLSAPLTARPDCSTGIVLIAGTGSVAMSFRKDSIGLAIPLARSGGYGYLLGDPGSGFHNGQLAITSTLAACDAFSTLSPLHLAVLDHFHCREDPERLLSRIYQAEDDNFPGLGSAARIASVCKTIFEAAFAEGGSAHYDQEALYIVRTAARALATSILPLVTGAGEKIVQAEESTLILGGSLLQIGSYIGLVEAELQRSGIHFKHTEAVENAGVSAALVLAREVL